MQIALVLALLVLAVIFFALEILSVDVITLMLLAVLILAGILTPTEAFAGFSSDVLVTLAGIFVLSGALTRTGVMDAVGRAIYNHTGGSYRKLILAITGVVCSVSAFMHNTTTTAIFIPPVLGIARRMRISASKFLMPVAFAAMLGGTCTLIGTSTNMAASAMMLKYGLQPIALFEFLPIGLVIVGTGILYMVLFGNRLLPTHKEDTTREYHIKGYLTEVLIQPGSDLIGKPIKEVVLKDAIDWKILAVLRNRQLLTNPTEDERLDQGDILLIEASVAGVTKIKGTPRLEIKADMRSEDAKSKDMMMIEVLIMPRSDFVGRSLKEINFRQKYGLSTLAIYRHGMTVMEKVGKIKLELGDVLLVYGPKEQIERLRQEPDLWILSDVSHFLLKKTKGAYVVAFFFLALLLGGLEIVPLSMAILLPTILTILTKCITPEEAYRFIEWRLLILIAGMTAYGTAMTKTGADKFLAEQVVHLMRPYGVTAILGGFFLLTIILTQPLSNAAAALVVLPVAIATAQSLGVNPRTFAIAVTLAASFSFLTPMEPSCILVYSSGKYKFLDFAKFGSLLTLMLFFIVLALVPMIWPLW